MHHFSFILVLQALFRMLSGTACSEYAGFISPSQANNTAGSTIQLYMSTVDTAPSSLADLSTDTKADPLTWVESHPICRPAFPTVNKTEFELLELCTLVGEKLVLMVIGLGIPEKRLGHFDPTLLPQLHAIDECIDMLQYQHSCQSPGQEAMPCPLLSQLRGRISSLLAKVGGSDQTGHDAKALEILRSEIRQLSSEMSLLLNELTVLESLNEGERLLVLDEKIAEFNLLIERATVQELRACHSEHGLLEVCLSFREIMELTQAILVLLNRELGFVESRL